MKDLLDINSSHIAFSFCERQVSPLIQLASQTVSYCCHVETNPLDTIRPTANTTVYSKGKMSDTASKYLVADAFLEALAEVRETRVSL